MKLPGMQVMEDLNRTTVECNDGIVGVQTWKALLNRTTVAECKSRLSLCAVEVCYPLIELQ